MPSPVAVDPSTATKSVFRTGPQWPWLVGALIVFGLLLNHQLAYLYAEEMPMPVLVFMAIPTAAGWAIVAFSGIYVLLFSTRTMLTIDPGAESIGTSTWILGAFPIHAARRPFQDVRYVRIGLESALSQSAGSAAAGCMVGLVKRIVLFMVFGIWAFFLFWLFDPDSSPTDPGMPIGQLVFNNRDTWILARGSEARVEAAATTAARMLHVRLGG